MDDNRDTAPDDHYPSPATAPGAPGDAARPYPSGPEILARLRARTTTTTTTTPAPSGDRDRLGRFAPGHAKPGPGRPREVDLRQLLRELARKVDALAEQHDRLAELFLDLRGRLIDRS